MAKKTAGSGHRGIYRSGSRQELLRRLVPAPDFEIPEQAGLVRTGTVRGISRGVNPESSELVDLHSLLVANNLSDVADAGRHGSTFPFRNCRRPLPSLSPTSTSRRLVRPWTGTRSRPTTRSCSPPRPRHRRMVCGRGTAQHRRSLALMSSRPAAWLNEAAHAWWSMGRFTPTPSGR